MGYIRHEKGIDLLVEAFSHVLDTVPDAELEIVGAEDGGSRGVSSEIQAALTALGRKGTGRCSRTSQLRAGIVSMLRRRRRACRSQPHRRDAPGARRTGRAFGCPVIGTSAGGIPTSIADGVHGLLVPTEDSRVLTDAILRVMQDCELRERLVAGGVERARQSTVEPCAGVGRRSHDRGERASKRRSMKTRRGPQIRLCLAISAAIAVIVVAERQASTMLAQPSCAALDRPEAVQFFHRTPSAFPPIRKTPTLLLVGNSHTYALPGLHRGDSFLRDRSWASRPVLIDDISAELGCRQPDSTTTCYALAYPNFLPYEMLTTAWLTPITMGSVRMSSCSGLTWRNIARDSQLCPEAAHHKEEPDFAAAFAKMLTKPGVDADKQVLDAIAADVRWGAAEIEKGATPLGRGSAR